MTIDTREKSHAGREMKDKLAGGDSSPVLNRALSWFRFPRSRTSDEKSCSSLIHHCGGGPQVEWGMKEQTGTRKRGMKLMCGLSRA